MAAVNGLVHLPAYAAGSAGGVLENTPYYLNFHTTGYGVDPSAPAPAAWLAFLDALWPGDRESVALLREWFGYLLTPDNRMQKMLWMVGPTRSGKGTICNVVRKMVGESACAAPALWKFGESRFARSSLVGKAVALIEDCKLSKNIDTPLIVECLLTVVGEGNVEIERKGKDPYDARLDSRFVIASNDPPTALLDDSGAMLARTCLLETKESFLGREDRTLLPRLLAEMPGIFNWSVEGWKRLRERGRFTEPEGAAGTARKLADERNPVRRVVRERCDVGPEQRVPKAVAYTAYVEWCRQAELPTNSNNWFSRRLTKAVPGLDEAQLRINNDRLRCYVGLCLRPDDLYGDGPLLPHERPSAGTPADADPSPPLPPGVEYL